MPLFDYRTAYPSWMDLTASPGERYSRWYGQGFPAHDFTPATPHAGACTYCTHTRDSAAHRVQAQAAAYAPAPAQLAALRGCTPGDRCVPGGPGVGYTCDAHLPPAGQSWQDQVAAMTEPAEQVHGIRLDADSVVIGSETYVRRPF